MRALLVAACLLMIAPAALAQAPMQAGALALSVQLPEDFHLDAGAQQQVVFTIVRQCSTPAAVLPATSADIAYASQYGVVLAAGSTSVPLPQQVCASQPAVAAQFTTTLVASREVSSNFTGADFVRVHVSAFASPTGMVQPADYILPVPVSAAQQVAAAQERSVPEQASPGVGPVLLIGLLALVAMVRRT